MNFTTEKAAAKVNLNLQVLGKRTDGYHNLSSLFVFTDFADELTFSESDEFNLDIRGEYAAALFGFENNSVGKAAKSLAEIAGIPCRANIILQKNIPVAAGIGGGTADAAAAVRGLMRLWNVSLSSAELQSLLLSLGADVPASYGSKSVMVGGIGDILSSSPVLPHNLPVLLVNPKKQVPTKDVFALCDFEQNSKLPFVFRDKYEDAFTLAEDLKKTGNDLMVAAEKVCPDINLVLRALSEQKCLYAGLSGSGATCFALFSEKSSVQKAAREIKRLYPKWWIKETFIS